MLRGSSRKRKSMEDGEFPPPTTTISAPTTPLRRSSRARKVRHIPMDDPEEKEVQKKEQQPAVVVKIEDTPVTVVKQGGESSSDRIFNECVEYVVDEVKLLHRSSPSQSNRVYLMCPVCGAVDTHRQLGHHLFTQHNAGFLRCPGARCGGWRVKWTELQAHVEQKHFGINCPGCGDAVDVRKYVFHRNICKRPKLLPKAPAEPPPPPRRRSVSLATALTVAAPPPAMELRTIIRPPSFQQVLKPKPVPIALSKPVPLILQQRVSLPPPPPPMPKTMADNFEVLLGGKLLVVDGVCFYVKGDLAFTDCPLCEDRSMAVSVIGSHLANDHKYSHVACPAASCAGASVQSSVFQEHLLKRHGRVDCSFCGDSVDVLSAKGHFNAAAGCVKGDNKPSTTSSYDVETMEESETPLETASDEMSLSQPMESTSSGGGGKLPTIPCPHCGKQCSYLKKHIRDVHQPKTNCPVCGRRMGHSYLSEHMKIQHQGKAVPTRKCPLCGVQVQKLKNHLKATHKMNKGEADGVYERFYPMSLKNAAIMRAQIEVSEVERNRQFDRMSEEAGIAVPETILDVAEDRILVFDD